MVVKHILKKIINQDRSIKRLIVMINDSLINISTFTIISFFLERYMPYELSFFVFQFAIILFFIFFRIYDNVIKHIAGSYIYKLLIALFIPHFCYFLFLQIFQNNLNYEQVIVFNFFTTFMRFIITILDNFMF